MSAKRARDIYGRTGAERSVSGGRFRPGAPVACGCGCLVLAIAVAVVLFFAMNPRLG
ncbi:MAG: hypothetical protein J0I06_11540 [Planctomycetes bacterium]|nr:hypothetical protein [Planctomycetota bacterium]